MKLSVLRDTHSWEGAALAFERHSTAPATIAEDEAGLRAQHSLRAHSPHVILIKMWTGWVLTLCHGLAYPG